MIPADWKQKNLLCFCSQAPDVRDRETFLYFCLESLSHSLSQPRLPSPIHAVCIPWPKGLMSLKIKAFNPLTKTTLFSRMLHVNKYISKLSYLIKNVIPGNKKTTTPFEVNMLWLKIKIETLTPFSMKVLFIRLCLRFELLMV